MTELALKRTDVPAIRSMDDLERAVKQCSKCGEVKLLSDFVKNRSRPDGYAHYCKPCAQAARAKWIEENPDTHKAAKRRLYWNNAERERARARAHRAANPEVARRFRCRRLQEHPEKIKAVNAVNQAVANGDLPHISKQLCAVCNASAKNYHHESYDKSDWLKVIPLCFSCHRQVHTGLLNLGV